MPLTLKICSHLRMDEAAWHLWRCYSDYVTGLGTNQDLQDFDLSVAGSVAKYNKTCN